jgi:hypothetical protein
MTRINARLNIHGRTLLITRVLHHHRPVAHVAKELGIRIAAVTGVPARTVSRILVRNHVPRLAWCDPLTGTVIRSSRATANPYERDRPGELVHVDVKKLGRIPNGGGWRAHGRGARPKDHRGPGFDYIHAVIDDHSRLAYAEIHDDEKAPPLPPFSSALPSSSPATVSTASNP